jgi:hypothetical protein
LSGGLAQRLLPLVLRIGLGVAALRAEPGAGTGLGFLLCTSGGLAGGLALAWSGRGSHALDGWLAQRRTVRRHRLRWALERHRILLTGLAEVCRVQMQGAGDARTLSALDALRLDVAEDVNDVAVLIRRHGGRPGASIAGCSGAARRAMPGWRTWWPQRMGSPLELWPPCGIGRRDIRNGSGMRGKSQDALARDDDKETTWAPCRTG